MVAENIESYSNYLIEKAKKEKTAISAISGEALRDKAG